MPHNAASGASPHRAFALHRKVRKLQHSRVVKRRSRRDNRRQFLLALRTIIARHHLPDMSAQLPDRRSGLTLRPAQPDDEAFLLELRKTTMTEHLARAGEPTDDDAHRARLLHRYDAAQVVCIDGAPAGLLKAHRNDVEWFVVQLQIAPALQGRGIGEQALRTILRAAAAEALPVSLQVLKGNPAKRLYDRLGFEIVGEDQTQFHMRLAARAPAESEAERMSDKD
ncbi:ribosomal protein S18 acetylase RimI-like enzyme [Paraburkholderia sp. Clong3]